LGAQLVKHPTLDFGSGHDLRVLRSSPVWLPTQRGVRLSRSLCPSLLQNKQTNHKKKKKEEVNKTIRHAWSQESYGLYNVGL